jgi:hypothetical protein
MDYPTAGKCSKAGQATPFDRPNDEGSCWENDCHPPRSGLQGSNVSWNGYRIELVITSVKRKYEMAGRNNCRMIARQLAQAPMEANLVKVALSGAMFQKDSGCGDATDPAALQ